MSKQTKIGENKDMGNPDFGERFESQISQFMVVISSNKLPGEDNCLCIFLLKEVSS